MAAGVAPLDTLPRRFPRERDFRITPAAGIGAGGLREKAQRNVEALRTLKTIESGSRLTTPDEQITLARYSGWGALPQVFERWPGEWRDVAEELRALVTADEWESLKASTPNAHYTSPMVIDALWAGVRRLGIGAGARVLEPALGVGHFFGLQPAEIDGPRTGVELDLISARIARALYPDSAVRTGAYQDQPRLGGYDLVISNVPFGNYGVVDAHYGRHSLVTRVVHDYFIGRSLEEVRPGGIVAVVTSRYTLDKRNDAFRAWAGERGALLGAIRLPSGAFRQNAGTDVVTDVLFLQRRLEGAGPGTSWRETREYVGESWAEHVNAYFLDHPAQVLGRFTLGSGLYGRPELNVEGTLTPERLRVAIEVLPRDVVPARGGSRPHASHGPTAARTHAAGSSRQPSGLELVAPDGVKAGAYVLLNAKLYLCDRGLLAPSVAKGTMAERIAGMVHVRDVAVALVRSQVDGSPEAAVVDARKALNRAYDVFVQRFGPLRSPANAAAFRQDPDAPLLLSLEERYDRERNRADKAAIFTRRTVVPYVPPERAQSAADALSICLAETGRVDFARICELLHKPAPEAVAELGDLVFEDPASGEWRTREEYLSGNVRAKLAQARAAAESDATFARNVAALEAVQPPLLGPGEIVPALGASWIPAQDVAAFARHMLGSDAMGVRVEHAAPLAMWIVTAGPTARASLANLHTWGTERRGALELLEDALNQRTPTVSDYDAATQRQVANLEETLAAREKLQALRGEFERWLWTDPERCTRLVERYNDAFNGWQRRVYDGSHLNFPGLNRAVLRDGDLARHQKDGVWRQLQQRSTLLALPVGAGKTYTMIAAAQEARRLGLMRKALFVVPTSLVEQWSAEFYRLYPSARVLVGAREHLAAGARQEFLARCATSDFEAVILAHSSFGKVPVRPETQAELLRRELLRIEDALHEAEARQSESLGGHGRRSVVKEIEKAKRRLEVRIHELANVRAKDRGLCFEDLGFDALFVDEAHHYKNLMLVTKMNRVAGLPAGESERAWDMYCKTRHVLSADGRVVFATGTPVTNTLAEVFTMQRFLQQETLEELGLAHFDAWAATFARTVTSVELAPDGSGYRSATRFAAFHNAPELAALFSQVTELRSEDELHLERPALVAGAPRVVVVPGSPELRDYVAALGQRAEVIRSGRVDPRVDNMLKITSDGRRAALDVRELDLPAAAPESCKASVIAREVHATWERTHDTRSAQVVFCDLSIPKGDAFSFYETLRDELSSLGVPESEVRFIHEAESDAEKLELFGAVNAGRVRVVIGSTDKLGTGANIQERLIAAHHADAPWRPADVEQRNGRILRPGNIHPEVGIHYYVTAGSFDAYMWQTLERKQRFIDQLLSGRVSERSIEDVGGAAALTAAEAKALASGNPEILEVVQLDTEIRRLTALESHHRQAQRRLGWEIASAEKDIESTRGRLGRVREDAATARAAWTAAGERSPGVTIAGRHFDGEGYRARAAQALDAALRREALRDGRVARPVVSLGAYLGFELRGDVRPNASGGFEARLRVRGREEHEVSVNPGQPENTIASVEAQAHPRRLEQLAVSLEGEVARLERRLGELRVEAARTFDDAPALASLRDQRDAIVERLQLRDAAPDDVVMPDDSEPAREDVLRHAPTPGDDRERAVDHAPRL